MPAGEGRRAFDVRCTIAAIAAHPAATSGISTRNFSNP
jgi:hypothetical protein